MMTLLLTFNVHGAEPYEIDGWEGLTVADAIEEESHTLASEANADHIEDPSEESREAFRLECVKDATAHLRAAGDSWRDPFGVTWSLVEHEQRGLRDAELLPQAERRTRRVG